MQIEKNPKQLAAMEQFHKGNRPEGLRLQEEFAAQFREEYKDKDHCPCQKACRYHGKAADKYSQPRCGERQKHEQQGNAHE